MRPHILTFEEIGLHQIDEVGGKNASLGEMIQHLKAAHVKVPSGFATTAQAFRDFLAQAGLDKKIQDRLKTVDIEDIEALQNAGRDIRAWIVEIPFSEVFQSEIQKAYQTLSQDIGSDFSVAVRSSATAEDLPDASFAGQQETFLNVKGIEDVLKTIKLVFASLYNDRAIAYRAHHGFKHEQVALSAGVQYMVRSDLATSGVMFTVDTESGFDQVVFITASYGLGEAIVQGAVNPDEFYIFKPTLLKGQEAVIRHRLGSKAIQMVYSDDPIERVKTVPVPEEKQHQFCINDDELATLAQYAITIEAHYACPMDIEWAKDGKTGELLIVQARPETVTSRKTTRMERFELLSEGELLAEGRAIGQKIGSGIARVVRDLSEMNRVQPGDVLVTDMTDPDWEPVMKRAAAIVTHRGGRTCHAAIIARELGIPAVVGCGNVHDKIQANEPITVSCAQGDTGRIYRGLLPFKIHDLDVAHMPSIPVELMLNVGNPDCAFDFQKLPNHGVGLARLEFIINRMIGVHPKALLQFDHLNAALKAEIALRIQGYSSPSHFYVQRLAEGVAMIAAAFYPKKVIVRLSDFKSNEYAHLLGGSNFEPVEENPMIGFRGAARYTDPHFADCFALECKAMKQVREAMGFTNVELMVPFVRTVDEAQAVIAILEKNGLKRGENGLRLLMMCEVPSNALLAEDFLRYFDGFSIGSNDLTQLTLGLDRDSSLVAQLFDERNPVVKLLIAQAISTCRRLGKYVGICGQGPSDYPDFAAWLLEQKIDTISLNPDTVIATWMNLAGSSPPL